MVDRYRIWLGAGVLAGGVSAAMLGGTGVAVADETSPSAQASSESDDADSKEPKGGPADTSTESDTSADSVASTESVASAADEAVSSDEDAPTDGGKHRKKRDGEQQTDVDAGGEDQESQAQTPEPESVGKHAARESDDPAPQAPDETAPAATELAADIEAPSSFVVSVEADLSPSDGAAVMQLAAASTATAWSDPADFNLFEFVSQLSTNVYNLYTGAMQFLAGSARAPFGSPVRVETSDLTIGHGVVVQADWYFPPDSTPATGLIYFQHGMLATSRFYGATAAYLAEKTHSIVVVPTLTWNSLDTDNYPLTLPNTHRAIADLFFGDRSALTASAREAGFRGTLPTRVVLAGHSGGGGLVAGTARYMVEGGAESDLAGVVMLDGGGLPLLMDLDLAKIPHSIPVYNLAGAPSSWNSNGFARYQLAWARPGMFTGVQMLGGRHADSMQSTSGAVQFMAYLATGFSSPLNVAASRLLSAGWINDMFHGTHNPRLYGSMASPMGIVARSWLSPAQSTQAVNFSSYSAGGAAGCPAGTIFLNCTDSSAEQVAGREREGVAAHAV